MLVFCFQSLTYGWCIGADVQRTCLVSIYLLNASFPVVNNEIDFVPTPTLMKLDGDYVFIFVCASVNCLLAELFKN